MLDFNFYAPTKIYFGKGKEKQVGEIIKGYGYKTVMLMYGQNSIKKSGLYDRVVKALTESGIDFVEMGGVEPNPKLSFVRRAVKLARENSVEMILAVGGGSVIDAAKSTAAGAVNDCDVWDFHTGKAVPTKTLPVGTILTIAAAGSEMSASSVLTNMEENMKRGFTNELNRPKFSICNPELTYTVSKYQTACGIVDIMAHTMERYFYPCEDTPLTDRIAESILKSVIEAGKTLMENPRDYNARATMMWGSSLSHNNLTGCGRQNALAVHQLEHALSGEYDDVAHGAGLAVLFPAWAKYVYKYNTKRFAQFARSVWDINENDDNIAAVKGIEAMENYFSSIGMPLKLREFDIPSSAIDRLSDLCTFGKQRTIKTYIDLGYDDIKEIFSLCY